MCSEGEITHSSANTQVKEHTWLTYKHPKGVANDAIAGKWDNMLNNSKELLHSSAKLFLDTEIHILTWTADCPDTLLQYLVRLVGNKVWPAIITIDKKKLTQNTVA